jgi:hypothetical protein
LRRAPAAASRRPGGRTLQPNAATSGRTVSARDRACERSRVQGCALVAGGAQRQCRSASGFVECARAVGAWSREPMELYTATLRGRASSVHSLFAPKSNATRAAASSPLCAAVRSFFSAVEAAGTALCGSASGELRQAPMAGARRHGLPRPGGARNATRVSEARSPALRPCGSVITPHSSRSAAPRPLLLLLLRFRDSASGARSHTLFGDGSRRAAANDSAAVFMQVAERRPCARVTRDHPHDDRCAVRCTGARTHHTAAVHGLKPLLAVRVAATQAGCRAGRRACVRPTRHATSTVCATQRRCREPTTAGGQRARRGCVASCGDECRDEATPPLDFLMKSRSQEGVRFTLI